MTTLNTTDDIGASLGDCDVVYTGRRGTLVTLPPFEIAILCHIGGWWRTVVCVREVARVKLMKISCLLDSEGCSNGMKSDMKG